jgi:hypothetical protein
MLPHSTLQEDGEGGDIIEQLKPLGKGNGIPVDVDDAQSQRHVRL